MPGFRPDRILAWRNGQPVSHAQFLSQVLALAERLPEADRLINLCDDRYLFMLTLCAAQVRGAISLLPPNRLPNTVEEVAAIYPGTDCISDTEIAGLKCRLIRPDMWAASKAYAPDIPSISADHEGIIVFTSGSTGIPTPHPKCWGALMLGARFAVRRFGISSDSVIVATVPPQHMYGLELSVLVPLATGVQVESARPFYPEDIRKALQRTPAPHILVTTPVHLSACVKSDIVWPNVEFVISATAPLSNDLAQQVEQRMGTRVFEIYGCTEAGSIASRRTLEMQGWRWYDTVRVSPDADHVTIAADFLPEPVTLSDILELHEDGSFRLVGRSTDMIKIAGKRASLGDLNLKLNSIAGVLDGAFVDAGDNAQGTTRLSAVVVAPHIDEAALLRQLRRLIDPAFVPRRILFADRLPRTDSGKLPRKQLLEMIDPDLAGSR